MTKKIKLSYVVVFFILLLLTFFTVVTLALGNVLEDSADSYDSFYKNVYEYQVKLATIGENQALAMGNIVKSVYAENTGALRSTLEGLATQNSRILAEIEELRLNLETNPLASTEQQKSLLTTYLTAFTKWDESFARLASFISLGDKEQAEKMLNEINLQWIELEAAFTTLHDEFNRIAESERTRRGLETSGVRMVINIIFFATLAIVLVTGYYVVRSSVRLERETYRAKKRLDLIAAGTKDCCALVNIKNEKIDYYTHGAESLFGSHLDEISSLETFSSRIAKADREKFTEAVARAVEGAPARVLYRYKRTEQGGACYISTDLYPVFSENGRKQESVLLVSSDVTEKHFLQEHSETLSELFENGNYMICVFKNQSQMEYINQAALDFRGLDRVEQAAAMSFGAFFDSPDLYAKEIPDEIKKPTPMSIMRRVPLRRHDGQIVYVEQTLFAFKDRDGSNKYAVIGQDISEKIVHEEALEAAKTSVEAVKSAKTNIFSALGQRITAPILFIDKKVSELLKSSPDEKISSEIVEIQNQIEALGLLMNNVIDIAKMQTGVLAPEESEFDLAQAIDEVKSTFEKRFSDKDIDFEVRVKNIEGNYVGDRKRIVQVIQNLLANALAYTEKGSVSLSADVFSRSKGKITLGFTVADSGNGIHEDKLSRIFDIKAIDETTNLGLGASRQIALALGGDLTATSVIESGSVFCFTARVKESKK